MGEKPIDEVDQLEELFGRPVYSDDRRGISLVGLPKFRLGDKVKGNGNSPFNGYPFEVGGIIWFSMRNCWAYMVPSHREYLAETDLEKI